MFEVDIALLLLQ